MDEFISQYTDTTEDNFQFKVIPPKKKKILLYILMSLSGPVSVIIAVRSLNNLFLYLGLIFVVIGINFIPKLWDKVSRKLIEKNTIQAMGSYTAEISNKDISTSVVKNINKIIGLKFNSDESYYVEAEPENLDMNKISKVFYERIFDIVGGSLAMIFLFAIAFNAINPINNSGELGGLVFFLFIIVSISPVLISWRIPVIWTLADSGIRSIDLHHNVKIIGDELEKGIFMKVSGIGGLFLGYSFFLDNIGVWEIVSSPIMEYFVAALVLILFVIFALLPGTLITLIYMKRYHELNVNLCRNLLKTVLPSGQTIVKKYEQYYGV